MKLPALPTLALKLAPYILSVVAGLGLGWALWHPRPAVVETPAAAIRQRDSSLVLQRAPDGHAKPGMLIPKGGTVERIVHLTVQGGPPQPMAIPAASGLPTSDSARVTCPPLTVDLALVRMKDRTTRVIAKAENGAVLGGVDIPVENAAPVRTLLWSVGPVYNVAARGWGGAVTRDMGPVRLLGAVTQQRTGGVTAILGATVRF